MNHGRFAAVSISKYCAEISLCICVCSQEVAASKLMAKPLHMDESADFGEKLAEHRDSCFPTEAITKFLGLINLRFSTL